MKQDRKKVAQQTADLMYNAANGGSIRRPSMEPVSPILFYI